MPDFKVTFLFNQQERGFSESYYITKPTTGEAVIAAQVWGGVRYRTMAKDVNFMAIKIQDDAEFGDSDVDTQCRDYQNSGVSGDITAAGAMVRIQAGTRHRRSMVFRGFPDNAIARQEAGGKLIAQPFLLDNLDTLGKHLVSEHWRLRYTLDDLDANPDPTPIIGLTRDDDNKGVTKVETANWNEYVKGDPVLVRGCRGKARGLNGIHYVSAPPLANKVSIDWPFGRIERFGPEDIATATVRGLDYGYEDITKVTFIDIRTRQSGRAFFQPAGKSKSRL